MDVEHPPVVFPVEVIEEAGRQEPHESGQADKIHVIPVQHPQDLPLGQDEPGQLHEALPGIGGSSGSSENGPGPPGPREGPLSEGLPSRWNDKLYNPPRGRGRPNPRPAPTRRRPVGRSPRRPLRPPGTPPPHDPEKPASSSRSRTAAPRSAASFPVPAMIKTFVMSKSNPFGQRFDSPVQTARSSGEVPDRIPEKGDSVAFLRKGDALPPASFLPEGPFRMIGKNG